MDSSNSHDAGHRGRRDRKDGKRTQTNRSRSPRRHKKEKTADRASSSSRSHRHRSKRNKVPPPSHNPLLENILRPRKKVLDEAYITETPGVFPKGTFPRGQRERLVAAAEETIAELPGLLGQVNLGGGISAQMAATQHKVYTPYNLKKLDPADCPGLPPAVIRVTREDTLTAGIRLAKEASDAASAAATAKAASKAANKATKKSTEEKKTDRNHSVSTASTSSSPDEPAYPLIVNFANAEKPGGSWKHGSMAQEEALFYRSSLSLSCSHESYPLPEKSVLYSPCVFIIREQFAAGHKLLKPEEFPVVSAISVAALKHPGVRKVQVLKLGQAATATPALPPFGQPSRKKHAKDADVLRPPSSRLAKAKAAAAAGTFSTPPQPDPALFAAGAAFAASAYKRQQNEPLDQHLLADDDFMRPPTPPAAAGTALAPAAPPRLLRSSFAAGSASASMGFSSLQQLATPPPNERYVFTDKADRNTTKTKMRLVLRAAAAHGHRQLVLGALGCGVYANPPEDVARCWLEVLQEDEFVVPADQPGGEPKHWWKDVVFAVYEKPKKKNGQWVKPDTIEGDGDDGVDGTNLNSNYEVFRRILDGKLV